MTAPFEPTGKRPRVEVCVELIRELGEKDPISEQVVIEEIERRTGVRVGRDVAITAMWAATERMHRPDTREPGVERVPGGWVRMDPAGMMRWTDKRDSRAMRQLRRRARGAAIADPARLDGADRLRRDHYLRTDQMVSELTVRRGQKKRPMGELGEAS